MKTEINTEILDHLESLDTEINIDRINDRLEQLFYDKINNLWDRTHEDSISTTFDYTEMEVND